MRFNLLIKNYHNGGGDLTIELRTAVTGEKKIGSVKFYELKVKRKPDKHSSRLATFAGTHNTRRGYYGLGFSQIIKSFDVFAADGKFLASHLTRFYDIAVKSVLNIGDEEEITFIARDKSFDIAVSKTVAKGKR